MDGRVEAWKDKNGRVEAWKDKNGRVEAWKDKNGRVEAWKDKNGRVEAWKDGDPIFQSSNLPTTVSNLSTQDFRSYIGVSHGSDCADK